MSLAHSLRLVANKAGLEVTRADARAMWQLRLSHYLAAHNVQIVFDVGANDGGFAESLLSTKYGGRLVSFEPLPAVWQVLSEKAHKRRDGRWTIAQAMALSDSDGESEFFEAGNGVSSSLLSMTDLHAQAAPGSANVGSHVVKTSRLDSVLTDYASVSDAAFLKIDVQGAEHKILSGATKSLTSSIVGIQLELSQVELYEGQKSASELTSQLTALGYRLWDIIPGFRDPKSLRMLQYDGIFFRE